MKTSPRKEYQLSDVITFPQLSAMRKIVSDAKRAQRQPHKELLRYIEDRPEILKKCETVGLLPAFFAYQVEAILSQ